MEVGLQWRRARVGENFVIGETPRVLVGVMPPGYHAYSPSAQVWLPIGDLPEEERSTARFLMIARMKSGVSMAAATAEFDIAASRVIQEHPERFLPHFKAGVESATDLLGPYGIGTHGASETERFDMRHMLYDLLAGALVLLLIACSNVANLMLARATKRESELAVRLAMGATRGRLIQQLVIESMTLAMAACAVGCVLSYFGTKGISLLIPKAEIIGNEAVISLDWRMLIFTIVASSLTTVLCGLIPALQVLRRDLQPSLAGGAKGGQISYRHGKLRSAIVVGEIALSILLLAGGGLMIAVFMLTHIQMGFDTDRLLVVTYYPPYAGRYSPEQEFKLRERIVQRVRDMPGVLNAALSGEMPGYGQGARYEVSVPEVKRTAVIGVDSCDETLGATLGLHMIRGSWFSRSDLDNARAVAVINQTMAQQFFGDADPVGRTFNGKETNIGKRTPRTIDFEIVGVVNDMKDSGPQAPIDPMMFVPASVGGAVNGMLFINTKAAPGPLIREVQKEVWNIDPDLHVSDSSGPYSGMFHEYTTSPHEFGVMTFAPLAGIALLLVVIGVFSVMAYNVSLLTHEIGVRMALGAQQSGIVKMILAKGVRLIAAGVSIGLFASYALNAIHQQPDLGSFGDRSVDFRGCGFGSSGGWNFCLLASCLACGAR